MSQGNLSQFFGNNAFDPNSVKPIGDYKAVPAGKYPVLIEAAGMKATKKGDGHYLEVQFVIIDGPSKGERLWDRMNIDNPTAAAVEISQRTLSALCKATIGDTLLTDDSQFLQKTCIASVTVDASGRNSIRTYAPYSNAQSVQPQAPAAPVPVAPAPAAAPMAPVAAAPVQHQSVDPGQPRYVHPVTAVPAAPVQPTPPGPAQPVQQQQQQRQVQPAQTTLPWEGQGGPPTIDGPH